MATNGGKSKYWCFTINNPTPTCVELASILNYTYLVAGKEVGKVGTPHLQCFVAYNIRTSFATVKKQLPRAHIERMISTPKAAADYCKKDKDFVEWGNFDEIDFEGGSSGGKAKAANYKKIIELAEEGDMKQLKEDHSSEYFRHYHTVKRIAMDNPKPINSIDVLDNEWIYGKTGLGKSFTARRDNPGLYTKSHNKWWLGYRGEEVVLIDDLSKTEASWFGEHLKQWCDHYPFPAETKGDGMLIRPRKIIVTSNYSIEELWGFDVNLCEALTRRFKIIHVTQSIV